jgi:hypothetical protein
MGREFCRRVAEVVAVPIPKGCERSGLARNSYSVIPINPDNGCKRYFTY